jgi:diguanylate cyclase (GGDEF)-like protein
LRSVLSLCLILGFVNYGHCQRYTFKDYGQAQGLRNLNVDCMFQDHAGFLWLGTDNGLFRYDGARFVEYGRADGLTNPYILAIQEDAHGRLWIGTSGGLFYRTGDRFAEVRSDGGSLAVNLDSSLAPTEDGRMLVIARYRLLEVVPGASGSEWTTRPATSAPSFHSLLPGMTINSVLVDEKQRVWLGCNKAICEFDNGSLRIWDAAAGVPQDDWIAMFSSSDGGLWVRSNDKVIFLPRGGDKFEDRTLGQRSRLINNYYVSFVEDEDHNVITSAAEGVAMWSLGAWKFFGPQQGLSQYPVSSLLRDRDGSLWLGLGGHGLARWLGYGDWQSWTIGEGLSSPIVWGMLRDSQNRIWVAEDKGVSVSDPEHKRFRLVTASLQGDATSMMGLAEDPESNIWAVSSSGTPIRIDSHTLASKRYPKVPSSHQIYVDSRNRVWISTEQGLYELDDARTSAEAHPVALPSSQDGDIYRVVEDRSGTVWAAGLGGLFYLQGDRWQRVPPPAPDYGMRLSDMDVAADGSIWVVSDFADIAHLVVKDGHIVAHQQVKASNISSGEALFVRTDTRGWVWVGHDRGVDVFDGKKWRLFSSEDGLLWNDCDGRAFWADRDGSVWIGTSEGLSRFDVPAELELTIPLHVRIDGVRYGDRPLTAGSHVDSSASPLTIQFSPTRFLHDTAVSYKYRLAGIDPGWTTTKNAEIHYPPLAAGTYHFEVVALDDSWHEASPPVSLDFTIRPPWWQSWTARIAMVLLLFLVARWLWLLRIRQLLKRQKELQILVEERTRELRDQATHDGLTGLWNHTAILEIFHRELIRAARESSSLVVVLADLDYFKEVNDKYGHLVGDQVLREVGSRLQAAIRPYDSAGRYGGEEFLILLPSLDAKSAHDRLASLHDHITSAPIVVGEHQLNVGCSFGVALLPRVGGDVKADEVLSRADMALYRAKGAGRGRIEYNEQ